MPSLANTTNSAGLDLAVFDLSGTHHAIGLSIGRGSTHFTLPVWWPEPPSLAFAHACAREIAACHAPLLDELYGHAEGQGQRYEDLLRIICRERLGGRPVHVPEMGGCTSFAWRAPNGHILVGRNYDFYPVQRVRQRIRLAPDGTRPTLGMRGSVPCGRYDGVNDAGLFVSLHVVLVSRPERSSPGIPFHLIPRIVLETCGSVTDAIDRLVQIPHLHSFNYLLADSHSFAAVECHPDRLRIIRTAGDTLAVGNFYRHPDMLNLQRHTRQELSRARVAYLESGAWQITHKQTGPASGLAHESEHSWRSVQAALSDHAIGVCGHEGGHTTLWSCAADLTARRIAYTNGSPCSAPFEPVAWPN